MKKASKGGFPFQALGSRFIFQGINPVLFLHAPVGKGPKITKEGVVKQALLHHLQGRAKNLTEGGVKKLNVLLQKEGNSEFPPLLKKGIPVQLHIRKHHPDLLIAIAPFLYQVADMAAGLLHLFRNIGGFNDGNAMGDGRIDSSGIGITLIQVSPMRALLFFRLRFLIFSL